MNIRQLARFHNYFPALVSGMVKALSLQVASVSGGLMLLGAKCISFIAYLVLRYLLPYRQQMIYTSSYRTSIAVFIKQSLPKLVVMIGDQRPAPGNHPFYLPFRTGNRCLNWR